MRLLKIYLVSLAALFAAATVQAAPFSTSVGSTGADAGVTLVKGKMSSKKAKAKKAAPAKKVAGKAAGSCGTFMYHKGGKCVDARTKK